MAKLQVQEIIATLPYVKALEHPSWCDGWTTVNGRKSKCLQAARWKFIKSGTPGVGRAKSGYYCTTHLVVKCLRYSKYEEARAQRAYLKSKKESQTNGTSN